MRRYLCLVILLTGTSPLLLAQAEAPLGIWRTLNEENGKPRSLIKVYKDDGKLYGKVHKLFREPHENQDPHCIHCKPDDPRYNKRILGMVLMKNLEKEEDNRWVNGIVLDPDNGTEYKCYLEVISPDTLKVRAYLGVPLLGRTKYLYRESD